MRRPTISNELCKLSVTSLAKAIGAHKLYAIREPTPLTRITHLNASRIWDISSADVFLDKIFQFAHSDVITGSAASLTNDNIFFTCSLDKSCLIWDDREIGPALGNYVMFIFEKTKKKKKSFLALTLYEKHDVRLKDVRWSPENNDCIIYAGDEYGYILTIDERNSKIWFHIMRI
ncbi:hypothetical protein GQX74_010431 [Glossina fuscipes]|nr:hypothetical protein GQX74_010431 [Glossina fuscipes]